MIGGVGVYDLCLRFPVALIMRTPPFHSITRTRVQFVMWLMTDGPIIKIRFACLNSGGKSPFIGLIRTTIACHCGITVCLNCNFVGSRDPSPCNPNSPTLPYILTCMGSNVYILIYYYYFLGKFYRHTLNY